MYLVSEASERVPPVFRGILVLDVAQQTKRCSDQQHCRLSSKHTISAMHVLLCTDNRRVADNALLSKLTTCMYTVTVEF